MSEDVLTQKPRLYTDKITAPNSSQLVWTPYQSFSISHSPCRLQPTPFSSYTVLRATCSSSTRLQPQPVSGRRLRHSEKTRRSVKCNLSPNFLVISVILFCSTRSAQHCDQHILYVCLSARVSQKPDDQTSPNLYVCSLWLWLGPLTANYKLAVL